jgi:hypothetical protein
VEKGDVCLYFGGVMWQRRAQTRVILGSAKETPPLLPHLPKKPKVSPLEVLRSVTIPFKNLIKHLPFTLSHIQIQSLHHSLHPELVLQLK